MDLSQEELREVLAIFQAESSQYIQDLNDGFMAIEKGKKDSELIANLFRTAHSIKGAARMLGLTAIEKIAHKLEDILGLVKNGEKEIKIDEFDVLYESVDAIAVITEELSAKGEISTDVDGLVERLKIIFEGGSVSEDIQNKKAVKEEEVDEKSDVDVAEKNEDTEEDSDSELIDAKGILLDWQKDQTIRIHTKKLDELFNRSSELLTTLSKQDEISNIMRYLLSTVQKWRTEWSRHKGIWDLLEYNIDEYANLPSPELFTEEQLKKIFALVIDNHTQLKEVSAIVDDINHLMHADNVRTRFIVENLESEVKEIRMLPLAHLFKLMPRMVRDIARIQSKETEIHLQGLETQVDKQIIEELKDPLIHILRNSIDHGIELPEKRAEQGKPGSGNIWLNAFYEGSSVVIEIKDDGSGIDVQAVMEIAKKKGIVSSSELDKMTDYEKMNIIFRPGFSTSKIITDISGRGVGLDIVRENVEKLKGQVVVTSEQGIGTTFVLKLPLTLGTTQVLMFKTSNMIYSIPVHAISRMIRIDKNDLQDMAGKTVFENNGEAIIVSELKSILGNPEPIIEKDSLVKNSLVREFVKEDPKVPLIILESLNRKAAIMVDELIDEQGVVIKGFGERLKKIDNVMGVAILANGELANVLNPTSIIDAVHLTGGGRSKAMASGKEKREANRVLVVDDSITTRTLEKNILESAGFDVSIAINGKEAWHKLNNEEYDLVVSDIEMPEMNGFELIHIMRSNEKFKDMPAILVTSLQSPKDRKRGIDVGANAYITKGTFDQKKLLDTINSLIAG